MWMNRDRGASSKRYRGFGQPPTDIRRWAHEEILWMKEK
jgi:hypothetical protein